MARQETNQNDKKLFSSLIFVLIIFTTIYAILLFNTGLKIINEETCIVVQHTEYKGKATINSYVLDDTNEYLLQYFPVNNSENILNNRFCFETNVTSSKGGVKITIIDENQTSLATSYLQQGINIQCVSFKDIKNNNYLGVNCVDCDDNNKIYLMQELAGTNTKQVYYNGIINIYENDTINYKLINEYSCKTMFKTWTKYYLIIFFTIFGIILLLIGYNKIHDMLFKEFFKDE